MKKIGGPASTHLSLVRREPTVLARDGKGPGRFRPAAAALTGPVWSHLNRDQEMRRAFPDFLQKSVPRIDRAPIPSIILKIKRSKTQTVDATRAVSKLTCERDEV